MTKNGQWTLALAASAAFFFTLGDAQAQGRGWRGPPAAAYDACSGKQAGAACEFDCPRRGQVQGTCQVDRDDRLACLPKDRGPRGPGRRR